MQDRIREGRNKMDLDKENNQLSQKPKANAGLPREG